jgi:hypothetical protein
VPQPGIQGFDGFEHVGRVSAVGSALLL